MTRNPLLNALAALLYIIVVVSGLFYSPLFIQGEESILIPIGMLSLFVFSAAAMGYIFMYEPVRMFLEGEKQEGVNLFLKTLGAFAASVVVLVGVGLYFQAYLPQPPKSDAQNTKINIATVCEGALAYMTFPDAASADAFVAECKEGKHPEVIEQYKAQLHTDGAAI